MFETNFDFDYNSYKLNAVIDCFHSEEEELRMELINHMEKLYDELVPPEVKEKVDQEIMEEHNRQWQYDNCFALIHMHNDDDEESYFVAKGIHSLYDAASFYYYHLLDMKDEYTLDCLVEKFDSYDYLDKPVFDVLSDAQDNDKRISCTVDYDFETGILTFKENGAQESDYFDLNFLESAIERAERGGVGETQRHDSFDADIEWYINQSQSRYNGGENEGSTMHL